MNEMDEPRQAPAALSAKTRVWPSPWWLLALAFLGVLLVLGLRLAQGGQKPSTTAVIPATATATIATAESSFSPTAAARASDTALPPTTATVRPTPTLSPTLALPGPRTYIVQEGDTLSVLALRFGVSVQALQAANQLRDPSVLQVGQALIIPAEPSGPSVAPSTAPPGGPPLVLACPANTEMWALTLPADPIQIVLAGDDAYLVADGDLYRLPLTALRGAGPLTPASVLPSNHRVGRFSVQELVYAAVDPATQDLLLLDKSNDVFRYTAAGVWQMALPAAPIPGQGLDPQYLAVQPLADRLYLLDADASRVWQVGPGEVSPTTYWASSRLGRGVDLAIAAPQTGQGRFYVLDQAGRVLQTLNGQGETLLTAAPSTGLPWPAQIITFGERLGVVEGEARRVTLMDLAGQIEQVVELRLPGMRRLRSAALADEALLVLAGPFLYRVSLQAPADCPTPEYDNTYYFAGLDVRPLIPGAQLPFPGAGLPSRPRSYPGARRLYRYGVHEGVDLYAGDVAGLAIGSPVLAIAAGQVSRIDTAFQEMGPQEYEAALARTEAEHRTPPELLDKLRGQQVSLSHGPGVESHYCHLSAVASDLQLGAAVEVGTPLGRVGVSGTSAGVYGTLEGAHLHWEVWVQGRYLGQGLSLYETMRLWQVLFAP